jgi:hypothetical protein
MPDESTLSSLVGMLTNHIPPCGSDLSGAASPVNRGVDFRHILFAGWLVAEKLTTPSGSVKQGLTFDQLNRLCELGLLQQRAIDLYNSTKKGQTS